MPFSGYATRNRIQSSRCREWRRLCEFHGQRSKFLSTARVGSPVGLDRFPGPARASRSSLYGAAVPISQVENDGRNYGMHAGRCRGGLFGCILTGDAMRGWRRPRSSRCDEPAIPRFQSDAGDDPGVMHLVPVPARMRRRHLVRRHQQRSRRAHPRACGGDRRALHPRARPAAAAGQPRLSRPGQRLARRMAAQAAAAPPQAGVLFPRRQRRLSRGFGAMRSSRAAGRGRMALVYSAAPTAGNRRTMPSSAAPRATIALAAGGTGGHLFPAEALARELLARGYGGVIHTERRGAQYSQALEGLEHVVLPASSLEGGLAAKLRAALTIARGVLASRRDLRRRGAAPLVGFGGYPSFAPALAARSLGLPLLLHEQATRLSKANAHLLPRAAALATSFPVVSGAGAIDPARVVQTGNPVRQAILDARGDYPPFDTDGPLRLLVVGGSQGAAVFGQVVPPALLQLPEALRHRLRLSLQYRGDDAEAVQAQLRAAGVEATVQPFFHDVGDRLRE